MTKNILIVLSIILGLYISTNVYSQTLYLTPGEKTGLAIDSLLKIKTVNAVEIKFRMLDEYNNSTVSGIKSKDFNISGQFIILRGGKSGLEEQYYNLEKIIRFYFIKDKLIITFI